MLFINEQTWYDLQSDKASPVLFDEFNSTALNMINAGIEVLLVNDEMQVIGKFITKKGVVVVQYSHV